MGTEVLLPQIPLHVLARIAQDGKVIPGITKARSVLLFTDISGFTALTEALTAGGKEGIEEVTGILNSHFTRLSQTLEEHKGILLRMGGDSLLASFPGSDGVERGTHAAWEMLDWFKENPQVETRQGEFNLSMKAILGGGEYFEAILGGEDKNDWFPLGKALEELAQAEKTLSPGEFIVKEGLKGRTFDDEPYPEAEDDKRRWLAELTASFLPTGRGGKLTLSAGGEYRIAAPVFINVHGYDHLDPDFNQLNQFYLSLWELLTRYHGAINKVDIAPQGVSFLVLFGAPVSHERDRANAAGFFYELAGLSTELKLKAGLSYGAVFAGFVGGAQKEYTVIGQRVNTAAKIMSASEEGEFVLAAEARDKFIDLYKISSVPEVVIGDVSYQRYRLDEPAAEQASSLAEWTTHDDELEEAVGLAGTDSKVIGISGDHGMGKSRFLHRLSGRLASTHNVLEVSLDERGAPYQIFRRILMAQANLREEDPADVKRDKLLEHLRGMVDSGSEDADELVRRYPFIAAMLFGLPQAKQVVAPYSPELRVENLMDAFRIYLLRRAIDRPLALMVDNLGRADTGSVEMLSFVTRTLLRLRKQGITIVCVYHPELRESFTERCSSEGTKPAEITLEPLSQTQSRRLIADILTGEAAESLNQFVYERSVGIPTVIEQWLGYLEDKKLISEIDGVWNLVEGVEISEIPDDLYSLVFSRLDRLPEEVRQVLKLGAVYGIHFPAPIIGRVLEEENLDEVLAPAVQAGLVYSLEAAETEYVFRQTMVRDVCYDSLLRGERESFHRDIVRSVESLYPDSLERYFAILAHHSMEAGDWDRTFDYSLKSADSNRRLFRNQTAANDYARAIDIWTEHFGEGRSEQLYDSYTGRAMVHQYEGRFPEAAQDYSQARKIAIRVGLAEKEVDALNKMAYISRFMSDFDHLFEYAEDALRRSNTLGYKRGLAIAHLERGAGFARQGQSPKAQEDFESAFSLSQESADAENANRALNNLATLNRFMGRHKQALAYYEQAVVLAEKSEDKLLLANNLLNIGRLQLQIGKPDDAEAHLERALRSALEIGHRETIIKCTIELSGLGMMKGDFEGARARLDEASVRAEELGNPLLASEVQMRKGHLDFYAGRIPEASDHYRKALMMRKLVGDPMLLADTHVNLGNTLQILGKVADALSNLEQAHKLFSEAGNPMGATQALVALSSLHNKIGNFGEAIIRAEQALELASETGDALIEADAKLQFAAANLPFARYEKTIESVAFADAIGESPPTAHVLVRALRLEATAYAKIGRFTEGLARADKALQTAKRSQNPELIHIGMTVRLENLIGMGDVEKAVEELLEFQEIARQVRPELQEIARLTAAQINLANENYTTAVEMLSELLAESKLDENDRFMLLLLLARAEKGKGDIEQARNYGEDLIKRIGDNPLYGLILDAHLILASLVEGRLRLETDDSGGRKIAFASRVLRPFAASRWKNHQNRAGQAARKIIASLSGENAEAFARLVRDKGLDTDRLRSESKS